ncbi:methionine synthase [Intrasporangium oryzae NRRL B-24470]|uniref:Methionine synthase n=1 Tax=Intrasporangium oryzae NRRL B-24470 TaxID=1386089 RepID=W9GAJ7_9MICO|nr:methionine synthase [Intrasporangium oryzae]EWT02252.1 methionine synthase [Intrasporangium oryzae NRRL B-24470]
MTHATGIGSWPGTSVRDTLAQVRELLEADLPYLPELPARGPGADMIGRTAGLLVELPVDLQPSGWRLVDRPGQDAARTAAFLREDLDELAEAFDGHTGPLKLQAVGPWTLAAEVWLPRGERALADEGASRDLVDSLAEGLRAHVAAVRRLVPGAEVIVQVDEPSLPAVLAGSLPTASGFGRIPPLDPQVALAGLRTVLESHDGETVIHCCAADPPIPLLRDAGPSALSVDTSLLRPRGWEGLAVAVEDGIRLHAGAVPTDGTLTRAQEVADRVGDAWRRIGMPLTSLDAIVVTPACGLAGLTPPMARTVQRTAVEAAQELTERSQA